MIKNVVFDIGNVLIDFPWDEYCHSLYNDAELEKKITALAFKCPMWTEFDRGVMEFDEIVGGMIAMAPELESEIRTAIDRVNECIIRLDYAIPWIESVKERGLNAYYLSNYSDYVMSKSMHAMDFLSHMDGGVFSWKVQTVKPEEKIYRILFDSYNLNPEECVFIDDMPANVEVARKMGMKAILFKNYEQAERDLNEILGN